MPKGCMHVLAQQRRKLPRPHRSLRSGTNTVDAQVSRSLRDRTSAAHHGTVGIACAQNECRPVRGGCLCAVPSNRYRGDHLLTNDRNRETPGAMPGSRAVVFDFREGASHFACRLRRLSAAVSEGLSSGGEGNIERQLHQFGPCAMGSEWLGFTHEDSTYEPQEEKRRRITMPRKCNTMLQCGSNCIVSKSFISRYLHPMMAILR